MVRNLALGPQRYTDLLEGLPGLSPNVLAERLKHLEASGILEKRQLPPPAASTVYELTEQGVALTDVVLSLARWGHQFMDAPGPDDSVEVRWLLVYLRSIANLEAAEGVRETYEFLIDDDRFHVVVDDGTVDAVQGPSPTPPAVTDQLRPVHLRPDRLRPGPGSRRNRRRPVRRGGRPRSGGP